MLAIPQTVTHVASRLHLPVEGLIERSLQAYLRQELRATQLDIADFQDLYDLVHSTALQAHIEQGKIYSHPAWEDSIEWEHLETYLAHLKRLLEEMPNVS